MASGNGASISAQESLSTHLTDKINGVKEQDSFSNKRSTQQAVKNQPDTLRKLNRPVQSTFLSGLPDKARVKVLSRCLRRSYKKQEQIVREFERDTNLYFIDGGKVRVTVFSDDGREVCFNDLGSGENFGELAAIDGGPRSANVIALEDSVITVMPAEVLHDLLQSYPGLAIELLNQLSRMVRRLCDRIFEYSTLATQNRIHCELLRLSRRHVDLDGIARIKNPPTHAEFASRVSCHREAVSRELKALEKEGLLKKQQRKWILPDISGLEDLMAG